MPPIRRATREGMRDLLDAPPPEDGIGASEALDRLLGDVIPHLARLDHPRYFAFIPCSGTWPGALGDLVASALSVYATSWLEGAGPTQLELTVLDWFKEWIGYPADADGQLTSGGSTANLQALACARERRAGAMRDDLIVYVSDQAHSSIARAARILGFTPNQVRVLPTDRDLRLRPEIVASAIDADAARGLHSASGERERRRDQHRRGRSPPRPRRDLPRARRLAPRRRGVRRLRGPRRPRARAPRRDRPGRLRDTRPAQAALPVVRVRRAPRPRAGRAALRVRDRPALPPRHARPGGRGEPRRSRNPAEQDEPRLQALALDSDLRTRRVPARDRPLVATSPSTPRGASRKATSSSSSLRRRSGSCASAVVPRGWTTRSSSRD